MDKEILEGFQEETNKILKELEPVIETLEGAAESFPADALTEFAQKIDRIMGGAKTILTMYGVEHQGLKRIGQIAEVCKTLGYKAAELKNTELLPIFAAFWADTLEVVSELTGALEDEAKTEKISGQFSLVLEKRLRWLADKVLAMQGAAAAKNLGQLDVDSLLKDLGL